MAQGFSLKDQLFNAETLGRLGAEYAAGLPGFDGAAFAALALGGVPERSLLACLDWFADCLEPHLAADFETMAAQLEAVMPAPLDPALRDDDFGSFIHAVPGVLAVRHGLENHRPRALDLLHAATKRFSMEFYIRPFLNRWPEETLARMALWARDENYHVRRLVSEGLRPKLPWARAISVGSVDALPMLDVLHADKTRFVTRSVANHLNDIAKNDVEAVLARLSAWREAGVQEPLELEWMVRHALRTAIKSGHPGAMEMLGFRAGIDVDVRVSVPVARVPLGDPLAFDIEIMGEGPVLVDYRLVFARPNGRTGQKVFKLKTAIAKRGEVLRMSKLHKLRADASTFRLYTGAHCLVIQVNGVDRAEVGFELV